MKLITVAILATICSDLKNKVKDYPIVTILGETYKGKSANDF